TDQYEKFVFSLTVSLLCFSAQSCSITGQLYEYKYVNKAMKWEKAQQYCIQHHTDLATVTNMTDMKRLREAAKNVVPNPEAWIGLYRPQTTNRRWHWSLPGLEFNETNWGFGESSTVNEYCGAIRKNLTWVDHGCGADKHFICYNGKNTAVLFSLCRYISVNKNKFLTLPDCLFI
uniref:C-type lectin domain-containing protein n=1 Tax=Oryzias latipes TaxID=8090 RepID=A0A3B3IIW9_ORYLA